MAFHAVADDGGGLSIPRPKAKLFQRVVHPVVLRGICAVNVPVERSKNGFQLRHGEHHAVRHVELAVVSIHHHAQVIQVLLTRVHDGFPDWAFLQLAIAGETVHVEPWRRPPRDSEPLRD